MSLLSESSGSLRTASATPLPDATPQSQGFSAERLKRVDEMMAKAVADGEVGGMLTMLIRDGKMLTFGCYGEAAPERAMSRDTIFRLFSMTKAVTSVAMMMLFEDGKWALDDPVTRFIPEFADLQVFAGTAGDGEAILEPIKRPPTMRELMSHMAGFGYGFGPTPADQIFREKNPAGASDLQDMVERIAAAPLLGQPGTGFRYSMANDIQGRIIEKLSGLKFSEFLRARIFEPLNMVDTGFHVPPEKWNRFASLYSHDEDGKLVAGSRWGGPVNTDFRAPPPLESGGAGLVSTIDDFSRFAAMLANSGALGSVRLLVPATIAAMQVNMIPDEIIAKGNPFPMFNKGLGWGLGLMTVHNPAVAGRLEGKGTLSWEGAAGTWFWADTANNVAFVGLIQNFEKAGVNGYDGSGLLRPIVYSSLLSP